jgi:hypothetical protein
MFIIKIDDGCYKANYSGVGQTTPFIDRARRYKTRAGAKIGLAIMRKYKPFPDATIVPVELHNE